MTTRWAALANEAMTRMPVPRKAPSKSSILKKVVVRVLTIDADRRSLWRSDMFFPS